MRISGEVAAHLNEIPGKRNVLKKGITERLKIRPGEQKYRWGDCRKWGGKYFL